MDIWGVCKGEQHVKPLSILGFRVVESQSHSSTMKLVDSVEEQMVLEEIIEEHKPRLPQGSENIHFLYSTPFRYPPLQYGSRFGSVKECGLFYGAEQEQTAFAEKAYYQLAFLKDSQADFKPFNVPLTLFEFQASSSYSVDLTAAPFNRYQPQISHKTSYADSQMLGASMRAAGVELFTFVSARCPAEGHNIGIYAWQIFRNGKKAPKAENYNGFQTKDAFTVFDKGVSRKVAFSFKASEVGL